MDDPVARALAKAPEDDEPLTPEEADMLEEGLEASRRGDVLSDDELWARLEVEGLGVSRLDRITADNGVCGGRPCIRGMRIRVKDILEMLAGCVRREEILVGPGAAGHDRAVERLDVGRRQRHQGLTPDLGPGDVAAYDPGVVLEGPLPDPVAGAHVQPALQVGLQRVPAGVPDGPFGLELVELVPQAALRRLLVGQRRPVAQPLAIGATAQVDLHPVATTPLRDVPPHCAVAPASIASSA